MDQNITVSIIMLSYNQAKYIVAAIESVLNQNFGQWELLIIDAGSRDNSEQLIARYLNNPRIKFVKQSNNLGISQNRNTGLNISQGEFIAVLDSDDVWIDPDKLLKQVEFMKKNPDCVLVGSNFERIDENGRVMKKISCALTDKNIRENLLFRNQFAQSSVLFKKSAALSLGGYDETLPVWEDYDLWLRLGQIGQIANLAAFTLAHRSYPTSTSASQKLKRAFIILKVIYRYRRSYSHFYLALFQSPFRFLRRILGFS